MLKIDRFTKGDDVRLVLSGRIETDDLAELTRALGRETGDPRALSIDLAEIRLVNRDAVRFLVACVASGLRLVNPPAYVREWMARERNGQSIDPPPSLESPPADEPHRGHVMNDRLSTDTGTLPGLLAVTFSVNGAERALDIDPRSTLLDVLREQLQLTGTKKGCDQGTCGACTVIIDGRRVLACLTLAASSQAQDIRTIEGMGSETALTPLQEAFVECDAYQCGFCTPGQILSAAALLDEAHAGVPSHVTPDVRQSVTAGSLSADEIRERMSGNLCRCGAYPNIVAAVQSVLTQETRR